MTAEHAARAALCVALLTPFPLSPASLLSHAFSPFCSVLPAGGLHDAAQEDLQAAEVRSAAAFAAASAAGTAQTRWYAAGAGRGRQLPWVALCRRSSLMWYAAESGALGRQGGNCVLLSDYHTKLLVFFALCSLGLPQAGCSLPRCRPATFCFAFTRASLAGCVGTNFMHLAGCFQGQVRVSARFINSTGISANSVQERWNNKKLHE